MKMKLIWSFLVSIACICGAANLLAKPSPADGGYYTTKDSEFYLTPEQILFIRPGLELEIIDVVIPADLKPEVTFKLTDPSGLPLDRTGVHTPGPVSTSFILSFIPEGETAYLAYTKRIQTSPITGDSAEQGTSDSGGSYTQISVGTYKYKFGTVLPADYDTDVTHTLGIYARRDLREFDLDRYVTNELEHFVPSGMSDPMPRDIVTTETCNARCHDPLAIHGGSRQEVGLCILCHNPWQDIDPDTGNSVDMPLMVHKIHMGVELTKGYNIIGYMQNDHDYSEVVYPAEITECESCHTGGTPTANFPMVANPAAAVVCDATGNGKTTLTWEHTGDVAIYIRSESSPDGKLFATGNKTGSIETGKWVRDGSEFDLYDFKTMELLQTVEVNATAFGCVGNAPGTPRGVAASQHTNWMDNPTRKTCGSCHDYIDWETGEGHSDQNYAQSSDDLCDKCHEATGKEFGRSVAGAHQLLYKSAQLPNVFVEFLDITDTDPGDTPTVAFSLRGKNGLINPNDMNRLRFVLSGSNDDWVYETGYIEEVVGDKAVAKGNNWLYTFETPLPDDAVGSWTVSMEGRIEVPVDMGGEVDDERDYAENPMMAFAVTDDTAVARRMVVDDAKCESCHLNLSLHGGNRHDVTYCSTCHTPDRLDIATPAESVQMKWMIHKIHRGEELENGYIVVRDRGTYDFSDYVFTGDLRNCDACHVNNSQQLPLDEDLLPTITNNAWWTPMEPQAAAGSSLPELS
jgi:hypothetical protein